MLDKALLIKNFASKNKVIIAGAFLFGILTILCTIVLPIFIGKFYQLALHGNSPRGRIFDDLFGTVTDIHIFFWYFIILLVLKFIFNYFEKYFSGITGELFAKQIRETLFSTQITSTLTEFEKKQTGAYLLRYSGDTAAAQNYLVKGIIRFTNDCLFLVGALILFSFINFPLTAIILISLPAIFMITYLLNLQLKKITSKRRNIKSGNLAFVTNRLKALLTVKTFNRETIEIEKFERRSDKLFRYGKKYYSRYALINALFSFLLYFMLFLILFTANNILKTNSAEIDGSVILMYIMLTLTTIPVYRRLLQVNIVWQTGDISLRKLLKILNSEIENRSKEDALKLTRGDIQFDNVTFSYAGGKPILQNFNAVIPGRSITLIKGEQGKGKSTICKLIMGLYSPSSGTITLDKTDLQQVSRFALRKQVTIISDEMPLLGETIFEAISYSRKPEKRKSAESTLRSIGFEMPGVTNILDHPLKENARNLSAGQRKFLQIARALLTNKTVMLFDEPFKDLGDLPKRKLLQILHQLKVKHTIIIISNELTESLNHDNEINML